MSLHCVIVGGYHIRLSLVLEHVVSCPQRRQVDLRWVSHVVVRIPPLDLVKDREGLLKLVFHQLMLHLQCIVQLNLWICLLNPLDLIHRQRRSVV